MSEEKEANAENPERFTGLKLHRPKKVAAGISAVLVSAEHVFGEMNVTRGLKALAALKPEDGYDCPVVRGPTYNERSRIAEYCENGAKAIAEEATTKKLTADFLQHIPFMSWQP